MPPGKKPSVRSWESRGGYGSTIAGAQHVLVRGQNDAPTRPT